YVLYLFTTMVVAFGLGLLEGLAGLDLHLYRGSACGVDYVVAGVLSVLYFAVFEWLYGATPGKLLLRMRVIQVNGAACTLKAALIRSALRYVDGFFFAIPAYATMKAPLQQRLGDMPAQTVVVDAKDPIIREPRGGGGFVVALVIYLAISSAGSLVLLGASSIGP
ncbi:MAG: RDD family protein, partial [Anaerolineae bacterium]